jgi:hypothetical protein
MLIRIFKYMERKEKHVKRLFTDIFSYCLYNSYDFNVAGYNFDVSLCDLNKVSETQVPLSDLSQHLIAGLTYPQEEERKRIQERILLAHLDAQSYWLENYTDLRDFCLCLKRRFNDAAPGSLPEEFKTKILSACDAMIEVLRREDDHSDGQRGVSPRVDRLIVRSQFAGALSQYSHGLSVFFPWSQPAKFWPEYKKYRFSVKHVGTRWSEFLDTYFKETQRKQRAEEDSEVISEGVTDRTLEAVDKPARRAKMKDIFLAKFATNVLQSSGHLAGAKGSATDSQGDSLDFLSIKNYPSLPDPSLGRKRKRRRANSEK